MEKILTVLVKPLWIMAPVWTERGYDTNFPNHTCTSPKRGRLCCGLTVLKQSFNTIGKPALPMAVQFLDRILIYTKVPLCCSGSVRGLKMGVPAARVVYTGPSVNEKLVLSLYLIEI